MTKEEMLNKLAQARKLVNEAATFIHHLEDDGEFRLSILAELDDAEDYIEAGLSKIKEDYNKLRIKNSQSH